MIPKSIFRFISASYPAQILGFDLCVPFFTDVRSEPRPGYGGSMFFLVAFAPVFGKES